MKYIKLDKWLVWNPIKLDKIGIWKNNINNFSTKY
jgi:hypothetical protein